MQSITCKMELMSCIRLRNLISPCDVVAFHIYFLLHFFPSSLNLETHPSWSIPVVSIMQTGLIICPGVVEVLDN